MSQRSLEGFYWVSLILVSRDGGRARVLWTIGGSANGRGDESFTNFFRWPAFRPDGGLLLTPTEHFKDTTRLSCRTANCGGVIWKSLWLAPLGPHITAAAPIPQTESTPKTTLWSFLLCFLVLVKYLFAVLSLSSQSWSDLFLCFNDLVNIWNLFQGLGAYQDEAAGLSTSSVLTVTPSFFEL